MQMHRLVKCLIAALFVFTWPVFASSDKVNQTGAEPEPSPPPTTFVYQPPNRGAPAQRVGGGTRSINQLIVLAPDHLALTSQAHPRLFWYINPGFRNKLRFRLAEAGVTPPLIEIQLPPQPDGGIQHFDLELHGVRLEADRRYEWAVVLEPFPHERLPPLVSGGNILRNESVPELRRAALHERPYLAAQQGFWYDALDWVTRLIDAAPGNTELRLQRAALLEQGGLHSVAMYEKEMAQHSD